MKHRVLLAGLVAAVMAAPAFAAEGSSAFLRTEAGNSHLLGGAIGYDFNEHTGLSLDVNHIRPQVFGGTIRVTTATLGFEYRF